MSGGVFQGPAYGDPGPEESPGVNPLLCYLCHQVGAVIYALNFVGKVFVNIITGAVISLISRTR